VLDTNGYTNFLHFNIPFQNCIPFQIVAYKYYGAHLSKKKKKKYYGALKRLNLALNPLDKETISFVL